MDGLLVTVTYLVAKLDVQQSMLGRQVPLLELRLVANIMEVDVVKALCVLVHLLLRHHQQLHRIGLLQAAESLHAATRCRSGRPCESEA